MRRVLGFVAFCILGVASSATAKERAPRFGILVTVGPRVGLPFLANLQGDVGWVLRPSDKRFGDGKRHGFFGQPGGTLLWRGRKWSYSHQEELRGREDAWGPVGRGDPAKGDRVDVPLIPGVAGLSVSRKGGFGVNLHFIPIPGTPYPFVRGSATIYVVHPWLAPLSNKTLDGVDWVNRRVVQPIVGKVKAISKNRKERLRRHRRPSEAALPAPTPSR